ncbi:MAG TPA: GNAT family N-acetyltransferase [Thermoanaerobaculia bacterium]
MIRTATRDDFGALRALFARANEAPYDLAAVAAEKCFGAGFAGEPVVRVMEERGHVAAASVTCGRWLRILVVDRELRRRGLGSALLADAEARGARIVATEPGNYFTPGVVDTDGASLAFFDRRGYARTAETDNLEVFLGAFSIEGVRRAEAAEEERVLDYIEREFGKMWRFEASHAFAGPEPRAFIGESDGAIAGFAVYEANNRGLGFFGPTGVSPAQRGRGVGGRLLRAALAELHRLGHAKAVIPWTAALGYYAKWCGAKPAHHFVAFARPQT